MSEQEDEYASGVYRWWHLSRPSAELLAAIEDGWIEPPGSVLDLGCGLGVEVAAMVELGFDATGIDLSEVAIARARAEHPAAKFVVGDVRHLPFAAESFDVLLDRGCLHYLDAGDRPLYEAEAWRVLRPGGGFLLRACLTSAGVRNKIPLDLLDREFERWSRVAIRRDAILSDIRAMDALVARLEKPR